MLSKQNIGINIVEMKQPCNHFIISTMGFLISVTCHLYIETSPWSSQDILALAQEHLITGPWPAAWKQTSILHNLNWKHRIWCQIKHSMAINNTVMFQEIISYDQAVQQYTMLNFSKKTKIDLYFLSFLKTVKVQVLEILSHGRQGPVHQKS